MPLEDLIPQLTDTAYSLKDVEKAFLSRGGTAVKALDGVTFEGPEGMITCIVGPTGSGKTTVLRIVSGLERADRGTATINGKDPATLVRKIGYLTQRHTLFPWMRVCENIALPLEVKGVPPEDARSQVAGICARLGLAGSGDLYPHELSGGMQQRAALGRLLASESWYWLMDEPFTALDERTRHQLQHLLIDLVRERKLSVLFVTHSIDEAVYLADRVVVLSAGPGRVAESFDNLLARPRNRLSQEYGQVMERIRTRIESVLGEEE
ncbi:MAG: ABC transporter ATP-binding protein [Nitrospirota bacterium]|nr:ABC transporter ATP-binding protein [Nitrospirota bacterium]